MKSIENKGLTAEEFVSWESILRFRFIQWQPFGAAAKMTDKSRLAATKAF